MMNEIIVDVRRMIFFKKKLFCILFNVGFVLEIFNWF